MLQGSNFIIEVSDPRRKQNHDATAKSPKDRLRAGSIIETMNANRQHADLDLASVLTEPRNAAMHDFEHAARCAR